MALMTPTQYAGFKKIHRVDVYKLIRQGRIETVRIASRCQLIESTQTIKPSDYNIGNPTWGGKTGKKKKPDQGD